MADSKQIFLTGHVGEWMADDFQWRLRNTSSKKIDVYISSFGGSVNKGFEMANQMQAINASGSKEIHTHILSHADSIATVLFLSVPKENRHIVDNSTMFVHEPRALVFDEMTLESTEKLNAELELQKNRIADFYVKNIDGLDRNEAISLMEGETNLNASKMLELDIVSEVLQNFEMAASRENIITNINQNTNKMGLFSNKKDPVKMVALKDGSNLLYNGELKEGTELTKVGEVVDLKGDHVTDDNRTIVVDENNKVVSVEAIVVDSYNDKFDAEAFKTEVKNEVAEAIVEAIKPLQDALKNVKTGTHKPLKDDGVHDETKSTLSTQASARKSIREIVAEKTDIKKARSQK